MASGVVEEMTDGRTATSAHRRGHRELGRIDVKFLREAGLEEALKKSRAEAEMLLGKVSEG